MGMYCFMLRSPLLRLVYDTSNSNRNWKNRYFFIQEDDWMCHPGDQEYMLVDKTWGIIPSSNMCSSVLGLLFSIVYIIPYSNCLLLQLGTA